MADWPDLDELKLRLDVEQNDHDDTLERDLAAAIAKVKLDVGNWHVSTGEDDPIPEDEPDDSLAAAALRMAELIAIRPGAQPGDLSKVPTYQRLLFGPRRAFGVA